jgi:hypothetical protein
MHAIKLITPGMMITMFFGIIAFMVIYRLMFRKKR